MNMDTNEKTGLGDPAITPSVSGSNLAQSGEDFLLPPIAPAHNPAQQAANAIVWIDALGSGKYKKTTACLWTSVDHGDRYCCLGVGAKVLKTKDDLENGAVAPHLADVVGLFDPLGHMAPHCDINGAIALTELNDENYAGSDDFAPIHADILANLDKVFRPEVAALVAAHYTAKGSVQAREGVGEGSAEGQPQPKTDGVADAPKTH